MTTSVATVPGDPRRTSAARLLGAASLLGLLAFFAALFAQPDIGGQTLAGELVLLVVFVLCDYERRRILRRREEVDDLDRLGLLVWCALCVATYVVYARAWVDAPVWFLAGISLAVVSLAAAVRTAPLVWTHWRTSAPKLTAGERLRLTLAALPFLAFGATFLMVPWLAREELADRPFRTVAGTTFIAGCFVLTGIHIRHGRRLVSAQAIVTLLAVGLCATGLLVLILSRVYGAAAVCLVVSCALIFGLYRGLYREPELKRVPESSDLRD